MENLERHEPIVAEAFIPETSLEGFDEGVIGRFPRARELQCYAALTRPLI